MWTTWVKEQMAARDSDSAWALIEENGSARYFACPIHRTKNFVKTFLRRAWIARWRVLNRPRCERCGEFMHIAYGQGLGARYWRCDNLSGHDNRKYVRLDWDSGLPKRAKGYVMLWRRQRRAYRKKRRKEGKPVNVARLIRRRWIPVKANNR